jgi:hypothetical protein
MVTGVLPTKHSQTATRPIDFEPGIIMSGERVGTALRPARLASFFLYLSLPFKPLLILPIMDGLRLEGCTKRPKACQQNPNR